LIASARTIEPQSWNRYAYCINNPLRIIDPDGEDYKDLEGKRRKLIDDYYAEQAKEEKKTVQEIYDALPEDAKLHYEGITNALEKTSLTDGKGQVVGTLLDLVGGLDSGHADAIRGKHSSGKGNQSYRLFVVYEDGAMDRLATTKDFDPSDAAMHPGMEGSFRQKGDPSIQLVYDKAKRRGESDIDFNHNLTGKAVTVLTFGRKGALSRNNSNIGANLKEYEKRYGKIPRKK
jgi:hypothetical protein